jgi:hypothetical protein
MALNSGFHIFSKVWIDGSRRSAGKEGDALGDCVLMRLALCGRMLEVVFPWPEFPTQFQGRLVENVARELFGEMSFIVGIDGPKEYCSTQKARRVPSILSLCA